MVAFDEVLAALDKETRELLKLGKDVEVKRLPTPSLGINLATRGGIVRGSQVLIWGPKSAGKSTFCFQQIAKAQREGLVCALIDVEGSYDPEWGERLGIDNDHLLVFTTKTMNNFTDRIINLIKAKTDVIIVDSITALMPAAYVEKDGEIKHMEDTNALGAVARDFSKAMSMINGANEARETTLILISQMRMAQKGAMYWGGAPTNGEAVKFYSSTIIRLQSGASKDIIEGEAQMGNAIINKMVGRTVHWTIEFNKTAPQGHKGDYNLIFDAEEVGIDNIAELIEIGLLEGVVEKRGSWYNYKDTQLGQGLPKAAQRLKEEPDLALQIESEIYG